MGLLLRRRTVRHLLVGLAPLLVLGTAVVVVLLVRFGQIDSAVRQATGRAVGTVVRSGLGPGGHDLDLSWTDAHGGKHVTRVSVPGARNVAIGAKTTVDYVPADASRIYVGGDPTSVRLRNAAYGTFITLVVLLVAIVISVVHAARRVLAERRPPGTIIATYARSRRGLTQRGWLLLDDNGREWWVPVHWEPVLSTMLARTPCPVHGRPVADRVLVIDVHGTPVWQSGRGRRTQPGGQIVTASVPYSKAAQRRVDDQGGAPAVSLARQLRLDSVLVLAAPLLGLLWAFLDRTGAAGWLASTVVLAGVLFWLPSLLGSDPAVPPPRAEAT